MCHKGFPQLFLPPICAKPNISSATAIAASPTSISAPVALKSAAHSAVKKKPAAGANPAPTPGSNTCAARPAPPTSAQNHPHWRKASRLSPKPLVPDILLPGLKLVFCGTALGRESARQKAYYANPGNQFWRALHRTALTSTLLRPQEYAQLPAYGLGLTDLCKTACGNDDELARTLFDPKATAKKMHRYQPFYLAFTSKNAGSIFLNRTVEYGLQQECLGETRLFVLPSPSGQARRWWREEIWQELAERVRTLQS